MAQKNVSIIIIFCIILSVVIIGLTNSTSASVKTIEQNGQSYSLFSFCAEELGYSVDTTKKQSKSTNGGEIIEYQNVLKENNAVVGSLFVTSSDGKVIAVFGDGEVMRAFRLDEEQDIIIFDDNVYISTQAFSELQSDLVL